MIDMLIIAASLAIAYEVRGDHDAGRIRSTREGLVAEELVVNSGNGSSHSGVSEGSIVRK